MPPSVPACARTGQVRLPPCRPGRRMGQRLRVHRTLPHKQWSLATRLPLRLCSHHPHVQQRRECRWRSRRGQRADVISDTGRGARPYQLLLLPLPRNESPKLPAVWSDVPHMPGRYRTTRILLPHDAHDSAYHVRLIGVSLGERWLDGVLPEMFARRKDGQGGCIVDLGTPMTTMAQEAYRVVEEAMWLDLKHHGAERVELAGYGLCVVETETIKGCLPSLSLHFAEEEAMLVVSPEQLFVVIDDDRKIGQVACLAMTPGRRTIVGALQQVDTRFVFDLKEDKLTFWPESCGLERV
ncbi:hypothetical protein HU200_038296 [Digitaria exilis]|uniref:Xylanase inhibitor C-terminal domain-containing protein n=1 Tax=Digitaria exilis TaxID=1010633 RepID=A0A835BKL6_9POAL|nr:hypothetical protein HU200_038296 [Digitaria exilis]